MKRAGETEAPTLVPDGGEEEIRELNQASLVRQWNGLYSKLRAMRPDEGSITKDGFTVARTSLRKQRAGQGLLTITYSKSLTRSSSGLSGGAVKDVIRISWERFQKPLRQHWLWKDITDITTWAAVDAWEKEDDYDLKSTYQYRVPTRDPDTGKWLHDEAGQPLFEIRRVSGSMDKYCDKRMMGIESFDEWRPVVSRVRVYPYEPETGGCGFIVGDCPRDITGYQFMKTGDETTDQGQKGLWTRTETWEGATLFDPDLYGQPASSVRRVSVKGGRRAPSR